MNADPLKLPTGRLPYGAQSRAAAASVSSAPPPAPAPAPSPTAQAVARAEEARAAALEASRRLAEKGSELTIEFEDALNRMVFRLVDTQTREVVRQIPSEEVLAIARALAANESAGVLLNGNA
jgi:flagellar protein FlaG